LVSDKLTTNSPKIIQCWRRFCAPSHSFVRVTRPISPPGPRSQTLRWKRKFPMRIYLVISFEHRSSRGVC
jgi:hypothetical protein